MTAHGTQLGQIEVSEILQFLPALAVDGAKTVNITIKSSVNSGSDLSVSLTGPF